MADAGREGRLGYSFGVHGEATTTKKMNMIGTKATAFMTNAGRPQILTDKMISVARITIR